MVADGIVALGLQHTVWEVPAFFDRIYCRVGDNLVSTNEIEHGVLRGNRPHPLARRGRSRPTTARSCPPVRAYEAAGLEAQLDLAARVFVIREVTLEGEQLTVTELFRWFEGDFAEYPDGLVGFLLRYLDEGPVRRAVREHGLADVAWRPYDWRLEPPHGGQGSRA